MASTSSLTAAAPDMLAELRACAQFLWDNLSSVACPVTRNRMLSRLTAVNTAIEKAEGRA